MLANSDTAGAGAGGELPLLASCKCESRGPDTDADGVVPGIVGESTLATLVGVMLSACGPLGTAGAGAGGELPLPASCKCDCRGPDLAGDGVVPAISVGENTLETTIGVVLLTSGSLGEEESAGDVCDAAPLGESRHEAALGEFCPRTGRESAESVTNEQTEGDSCLHQEPNTPGRGV